MLSEDKIRAIRDDKQAEQEKRVAKGRTYSIKLDDDLKLLNQILEEPHKQVT